MIPDAWRSVALAPPRAFGAPPAQGRLRTVPEDFLVEEELGFVPSGDGPHVLLSVCKRGANTEWVARELARLAGCRPRDVGYAGLKDRQAVTTQWFTVPAGGRSAADWAGAAGAEFAVLQAHAHRRKLPRGALRRNHFRLRIRDCRADREELAGRAAAIGERGVPNYFGPQRFGRDAGNLLRAAAWCAESPRRGRERPMERSFRLSAARSLMFNAVLAARVTDGSWDRLEAGDVANLDERGSTFAVESVDATFAARCAALEIHPTGSLWGRGELKSAARIGALEHSTCETFTGLPAMLEEAGLEQERRSLRLTVRDLGVEWDGADVLCRFALAPGAYATAVLREIVDTAEMTTD
ncbi:MAG: tRNA pseudouridine(13) synthase TruD [Steroidobacteraceae bacterium]